MTLKGPRPAWEARAACRGMGTDLFFPKLGDDVDPARAICARCEVGRECLDYIMAAESGLVPWEESGTITYFLGFPSGLW